VLSLSLEKQKETRQMGKGSSNDGSKKEGIKPKKNRRFSVNNPHPELKTVRSNCGATKEILSVLAAQIKRKTAKEESKSSLLGSRKRNKEREKNGKSTRTQKGVLKLPLVRFLSPYRDES